MSTRQWPVLAGTGLPYDEAMQLLGGDVYVKRPRSSFTGRRVWIPPRRRAQVQQCGQVVDVFMAAIFRDSELLITCELIYVFADPAKQTSRPVPPRLREMLMAYEAGEPMVGSGRVSGPTGR